MGGIEKGIVKFIGDYALTLGSASENQQFLKELFQSKPAQAVIIDCLGKLTEIGEGIHRESLTPSRFKVKRPSSELPPHRPNNAITASKEAKEILDNFHQMRTKMEEIENNVQAMDELEYGVLEEDIKKAPGINQKDYPNNEKLVEFLSDLSKYTPADILDIRDLSTDTWKQHIEHEELMRRETLKFNTQANALESTYINRWIQLKEKTGLKLAKYERDIKDKEELIRNMYETNEMFVNELQTKLYRMEEIELVLQADEIKVEDFKSAQAKIRKMNQERKLLNKQILTYEKRINNLTHKSEVLNHSHRELVSKNADLNKSADYLHASLYHLVSKIKIIDPDKEKIVKLLDAKDYEELNKLVLGNQFTESATQEFIIKKFYELREGVNQCALGISDRKHAMGLLKLLEDFKVDSILQESEKKQFENFTKPVVKESKPLPDYVVKTPSNSSISNPASNNSTPVASLTKNHTLSSQYLNFGTMRIRPALSRHEESEEESEEESLEESEEESEEEIEDSNKQIKPEITKESEKEPKIENKSTRETEVEISIAKEQKNIPKEQTTANETKKQTEKRVFNTDKPQKELSASTPIRHPNKSIPKINIVKPQPLEPKKQTPRFPVSSTRKPSAVIPRSPSHIQGSSSRSISISQIKDEIHIKPDFLSLPVTPKNQLKTEILKQVFLQPTSRLKSFDNSTQTDNIEVPKEILKSVLNQYEYTKPSNNRISISNLSKYTSIKQTSVIIKDWARQNTRNKSNSRLPNDYMEEIIKRRIDDGETDDLSIYLREKLTTSNYETEVGKIVKFIEDGDTQSLYDTIYYQKTPLVKEVVSKKQTKKVTSKWKKMIFSVMRKQARQMGWRQMDTDLTNVWYEMAKNLKFVKKQTHSNLFHKHSNTFISPDKNSFNFSHFVELTPRVSGKRNRLEQRNKLFIKNSLKLPIL